jgi:hypothetical protein
MEDLNRLVETSWRQKLDERGVTRAVASLQADAPYAGRHALQLEIVDAVSAKSGFGSATREKSVATIRIVSPPVRLRPGQIVQVKCAVQLTQSDSDSTSLLIRDSIGGEVQQWSLTKSESDWTECLSYRIASEETEFRVEVILQGLGQARIDELEVRVLER